MTTVRNLPDKAERDVRQFHRLLAKWAKASSGGLPDPGEFSPGECALIAGWLLAEYVVDPHDDMDLGAVTSDGEEVTNGDLHWAEIERVLEYGFQDTTVFTVRAGGV